MINKKKIIILCIVLVFLVGVLALVLSMPKDREDVKENTDEKPSLTKTKILDINYETIDHVTFNIDGEEFTLKKVNDKFVYAQNSLTELSESKILTLITRVADLGYTEKLDDISSYEDFGINENSSRCNFECNLGTVEYIKGNKVASSDMYYLKTNLSDSIYLISSDDADIVFAPLSFYKMTQTFDVDFDNLNEIILVNKDGKMTLKKTEADKYNATNYTWMDDELKIYARDEEILSRLITPFKNFNLKNEVSDKGDFASYEINKENYVTYKDAKGKSATVYYSPLKDNGYYIAFEGKNTIYKQNQGDVPFGDIKKIDILVRHLYLTKRENLKNIEFTGDINLKVEFKSGDIYVDGKKAKNENDERAIFSNLFSLYADDIISDKKGDNALKIVYTLNDATSVKLEFSSDGERYYNVSVNSKPTYKILKSKLSDMAKRISDLTKWGENFE